MVWIKIVESFFRVINIVCKSRSYLKSNVTKIIFFLAINKSTAFTLLCKTRIAIVQLHHGAKR